MSTVTSVNIPGVDAPITVRRRRTAKRVTLSVSRATGEIGMTLPARFRLDDALRFAEANRDWLEARVDAAPSGIAYTFGMMLPYRGKYHRVHPGKRRSVSVDRGIIRVGCEPEALHGMLERWLKREARAALIARSDIHADALGVTYNRLSVRDTRSRWGSCSAHGSLSYSWRVILAPEAALDYLAAHEVAHLREMNHGPRFWALVAERVPDYERWIEWFRSDGVDLHRYGRAD
jgi:predicted metal-dependent hydrolase